MRRLAGTFFLASLLSLALAWFWAGYEPVVQMEQAGSPLTFSPLGKTLAVGSRTLSGQPVAPIHFYSALDGSEIQPPLETHAFLRPRIYRAEYSLDGTSLAVLQQAVAGEVELVVFDAPSGARTWERRCHCDNSPEAGPPELQVEFGFAPDASFLYWSHFSCGLAPAEGHEAWTSVSVANLPSGKERYTLRNANSPTISLDSAWVASIADRSTGHAERRCLRLHRSHTGELVREIELSHHAYRAWPAFSADGRLVAVSSLTWTEVFEVSNGKRVFEQAAFAPAFLEDGSLATVSGNVASIWDSSDWSRKLSEAFAPHPDADAHDAAAPATAVSGTRLILCAADGPPPFAWLTGWARTCKINAFGASRLTVLNAAGGESSAVALRRSDVTRVVAAGEDRLAVYYASGDLEIWSAPPRRSYTGAWWAGAVALILLATTLGLRDARLCRREQADAA